MDTKAAEIDGDSSVDFDSVAPGPPTLTSSELDLEGVFALMEEAVGAEYDTDTVAYDATKKAITCGMIVHPANEGKQIEYSLHDVDDKLCLIEAPHSADVLAAVAASVKFAQEEADRAFDEGKEKHGWLVRTMFSHTGGVPDGSAKFRPVCCLKLRNSNVAVMLVNAKEDDLESTPFFVEATPRTRECVFCTMELTKLACR